MTDLTLNSRTLLDHMALEERLRERISDIARACHLIRAEGWPYREKKGSFDRWIDIEKAKAHLESYEVSNGVVSARFEWWCGDSLESIGVSFPLYYLDSPDAVWMRAEQAVSDGMREAAEARNARTAAKAAETKAINAVRRAEEARAKCVETIPGFEDLTPEAQAAILANITGA